MNAILLSQSQYDDLNKKLGELRALLLTSKHSPEDIFLDNQEFIQLMNLSKRTAQNWRDNGTIAYSQIGSKIYYRMSDVKALLDKFYRPTFD